MNDSDIQNTDILDLVDGSLSTVRMQRPIDEITARGRRLRTRRRSIAGAAAVGVLGASLAIALPLSGSSGQPAVAYAPTQSQVVNVDLAAWSVHTNADSTVTLTVREYQDPALMQQVLARAGVSAIVTQGANCFLHIDGLPVISKVLTGYARPAGSDPYTTIITPSAMPPGTSLFINFTGVGTPDWQGAMSVNYHTDVNRLPTFCLSSVSGQK